MLLLVAAIWLHLLALTTGTFRSSFGNRRVSNTYHPRPTIIFLSKATQRDDQKRYRYRNAKEPDISQLSKLLVETFDEHEDEEGSGRSNNWWKIFYHEKILQKEQKKQLQRRWDDLILNEDVAHSWIVVEEMGPGPGEKIVGFMELGIMPIPVPTQAGSDGEYDDNNYPVDGPVESDGGFMWKDLVKKERTRQPERPFLANLAVSKAHRRQGIATTLVNLALKQATKWRPSSILGDQKVIPWSMFLGVSYDNDSAISLYQSLNFTLSLDETDALSMKMLKRLKRVPRLYFEKRVE
jgi:ribosomal protein S18 acetylase RimI-like enzyme